MRRKWGPSVFAGHSRAGRRCIFYDLWPNLSRRFAPVNESVWEHLKLLYWPFLAAAFVLTKDEATAEKGRWCGLLVGLLAAPLCCFWARIILLSGFALYGLPLDLILYALAMAGGFGLAWHLQSGFSRDVAVRDYGRRLRCGAGAVFVRAAGSADFPPPV